MEFEIAMICGSNIEWSMRVKASKSNHYHLVRYTRTPTGKVQYDYTCSCRGYTFRKTCRHIKEASAHRCGWNDDLTSVHHEHQVCPECQGELMPVKVGT